MAPERQAESRERDDLDALIDDLFPDTDEGPGWFDAALVVVAAGLLGWGLTGGGPRAAVALGAGALALGSVLPVRWAWRRGAAWHRMRRLRRLTAGGVPLDVGSPAVARLVRVYEALLAASPAPSAAADAAHGALLEVATLLRGRTPNSLEEQRYAAARADAIEALEAAMRAAFPAAERTGEPDPALVVEARRELDEITGGSTLTRLDELTAEARGDRAG